MMASKIAMLVKKGKTDDALAAVAAFTVLVSNNVSVSGANKTMVKGMVLHIARSKKVTIAKSQGDKKTKRELPYHRLVFCR
jgi:ribosomal protein L21